MFSILVDKSGKYANNHENPLAILVKTLVLTAFCHQVGARNPLQSQKMRSGGAVEWAYATWCVFKALVPNLTQTQVEI